MLPKIGPKTLEKLHRLHIDTPRDLLYHFPHRYIDFSHVKKIQDLVELENATVKGKLVSFRNIYTRSRKNLQMAKITDDTGTLDLLWFNQPYLAKNFEVGLTYTFAGTVTLYQNHKTIIAPITGDYHTGKIIAVYPETRNLTSNWFRKTIQTNLPVLLQDIEDPLPPAIRQEFDLMDLSSALHQIHLPADDQTLNLARLRLAVDETLALQAQSQMLKDISLIKTVPFVFQDSPQIDQKIDQFIQDLPFKLTESQLSAWKEIKADLLSIRPANRLLEGDVGSGKTIVAALSCLLASLNDSLSLFLAPTEILAQQHFANLKKFLPEYPIELLTANSKIDFDHLAPNSIIVATHAAIFHKKKFIRNLGLLIVDEQHRFGVAQRSFLSDLPHPPHCLTMTATPIPRTISLTFLGHLDLSRLELPPSFKLPIKTYLVPPPKINDCYLWLDQHLAQTGEQAFIVCPFIEPSESMETVKSAVTEFEHLKTVFPGHNLELLHGRIKSADREIILKKFADKKIDILVCTPIIEVGIDYPNATAIIIQSAERFGLSQLHQLRGRVGRGSLQSYCYLFSQSHNDKSLERLNFLAAHTDGQQIAEYDLKVRGPGEAFSTIQHGFPSLKLADISDASLINLSQKILKKLRQDVPGFDLSTLIPPQFRSEFHLTN